MAVRYFCYNVKERVVFMYRVMIIDDEKALRSLLKASVNWEKMGLEIAGEAASGIEAINTIDKFHPDIIFVDIRMPFMDGIEFSKIALKRYPKVKIIILTAFDEFEYAKQCIGLGITDYLLKPIVRTDIQAACKKAIHELDSQPLCAEHSSPKDIPSDMDRVKQYIDENYHDSALNLTSIAQEFGYNSSYLSRRFKADCGQNISDYITTCRMEMAKKCLASRMLMYMTAKEVGIPDPNYFGKCFKKYTGSSYSELLKLQP